MNQTPDARSIFAPIWRWKWLILAVAIVVGGASYVYYKREKPTFEVSTEVYLGASSEEQPPTAKTTAKSRGTGDQAAIVNSIVVEQVHSQLVKEHKGAVIRGAKVRAKVPEKSEFLTITVEAHSARGAAFVANAVAQAYIKRKTSKRERGIEQAISLSRRQLRRIESAAAAKEAAAAAAKKKGKGGSASSGAGTRGASTSSVIQGATLSSKINELEASLGTVTAVQLKPAKPSRAVLVAPKPRKDAEFGFVLGLVLAALAVFTLSRFDRRLRSLEAIEAEMHAPLLAALPKAPRPIVRRDGLVRPSNLLLEPLRRLHTALHLLDAPGNGAVSGNGAVPGRGSRVILFVSPDPGDGKSTLVADLALTQREAGERVVVVEANFRRPIQARMLGLDADHSLADVLSGRLDVDDALQPVLPVAVPDVGGEGVGTLTATQERVGSLFLLAGDAPVPNPPALVAQMAKSELLRSLADRFDYVLIDAPSPLEVSDVEPLFAAVDGIVIVARVGHSREVSARRVRQMLERPSNAPVLGVVANFAAPRELKRSGFSSFNGRVRSDKRRKRG
ncbi:MAG: putative tyrosine-protein kinase [Solirubrobacterales bacterium]|nr:putative tyrosine-protein kinase [Solirubrobacterales bacterium]